MTDTCRVLQALDSSKTVTLLKLQVQQVVRQNNRGNTKQNTRENLIQGELVQ